MSRTDTHLDGMLRHLGAAYYDSLHGRATQADVTRAVDTVARQLNEAGPSPDGTPAAARRPLHESHADQDGGVHGWFRWHQMSRAKARTRAEGESQKT